MVQSQYSPCVLLCMEHKKSPVCRLKGHQAPMQHCLQIHACFHLAYQIVLLRSVSRLSQEIYEIKWPPKVVLLFTVSLITPQCSAEYTLSLGHWSTTKMNWGGMGFFLRTSKNVCFLKVWHAEVKKNEPEKLLLNNSLYVSYSKLNYMLFSHWALLQVWNNSALKINHYCIMKGNVFCKTWITHL